MRNCLALVLLFSAQVFAAEVPQELSAKTTPLKQERFSLSAQAYGYAGEVSLAFGQKFTENWGYFAHFGVSDFGPQTLYQITGKWQWSPWRRTFYGVDFTLPYLGFIATYTPDSDYFIINDDRYPEFYYYNESALRVGFYTGVEAHLTGRAKGYSVYYEWILLDAQLLAYLNNTDAFGLTDILGAGIGVRKRF